MCKRLASVAELSPQSEVNQGYYAEEAQVCEPSTKYSVVKKKGLRGTGKRKGNRS